MSSALALHRTPLAKTTGRPPSGPPSLVCVPDHSALDEAVGTLAPSQPGDLDRLALQRRFDRKFLLRADAAPEVLGSLGGDYRVLLAREARLALYDTTYFDTPDFLCFHDHRRKRRPHFKVRVRNYVDRELSMLEYKEKTAKGDTRKLRWERATSVHKLTDEDLSQLRRACPGTLSHGPLVPQARTVFHRLTLLNVGSVERSTLDFHLTLARGAERRTFEDFVVVEVKDGGRGQTSPLVAALYRHRARALSVSKYCVAIASLTEERSTPFLRILRVLNGGSL